LGRYEIQKLDLESRVWKVLVSAVGRPVNPRIVDSGCAALRDRHGLREVCGDQEALGLTFMAGSFFASLRSEMLDRRTFKTVDQPDSPCFDWIESFDNALQ
jgi:hypothetical protein